MGDKAPVSTDWEHATGLELKELQAAAEGKDFFDHYDFLKQPNGTKESPVVVTSSMPYRVVGATDPDDDTIVHWGRVEAGKPPVKIGSEWFVHKAEEPHWRASLPKKNKHHGAGSCNLICRLGGPNAGGVAAP